MTFWKPKRNRNWLFRSHTQLDNDIRRDENYEEIVLQSPQDNTTTVKLRRIAGGERRVFVNLPLPKYEERKRFVSNKVRTSKYTLWSFVPKNLFEQFRRAANMYFLALAILQLIPYFSVGSPVLTVLPICVVVAITAIKDGFEDYQRHKVDARYNGSISHTLVGYENPNYPPPPKKKKKRRLLSFGRKESVQKEGERQRGMFGKSLSMDVRVGDFILLRNGESCPADAVLLSSSDAASICFVETKDLDGETNLKPRQSVPELSHLQSGADCLDDAHFYIEAGPPTPDLYSSEGTLVLLDKDEDGRWVERKKIPIDIDNLILRGHVVRNTQWAIAVVLYTGTESKIILNSGKTPSKRSRIEKQMNHQVIIAFVVLFFLCLICAIFSGVMKSQDGQDAGNQMYSGQSGSPAFIGFTNFWSSLIIFQNIIPISLYVSIEFVKTFQAYFIWSDLDMYDEATDTTCIPKSWNLSDELGQVEYLFSDKTGTLTRNMMEFRECTVGGKRYGNNGFAPVSEGARGHSNHQQQEQSPTATTPEEGDGQATTGLLLSVSSSLSSSEKNDSEKERQAIFEEYKAALQSLFKPRYSSLDIDRLPFADPRVFHDLSQQNNGGDTIKEFFMLLALCHTVLVDRIDRDGKVIAAASVDDDEDMEEEQQQQPEVAEDAAERKHGSRETMRRRFKDGLKRKAKKLTRRSRGKEFESITNVKRPDIVDPTVQEQLVYKAESPDEAALVDAAKNLGFVFVARKGRRLIVDIMGTEYSFELLHVLEFNPTRRRMSVIVRRPEPWNDIVLYCKGADNVVRERLAPSQWLQQTQQDIDKFSNDGLRTLMLAYKVLSQEEYDAFDAELNAASTALEKRAEKVEKVQDAMERDLTLLGATGVEDKLQEGVPQCIKDLRRAGIKIWVLTGDKLETAINIGYASHLLDNKMHLWTLRGPCTAAGADDNTLQELDDISLQIKDALAKGDMTEHALIIEGSALTCLFEKPERRERLLHLALLCKGVVCCRVSPLQKAQVVEMVRQGINAVTLAVGDGANDVSMIQAANVGVGIAGKEGVQASMASDYAIAQFRFLHKLILVQGHWNYHRISEMILNFFYKNVLWVFPSLWYQIYSRFSGNIFYDYSFLQLYNVIFTVAPVVVLGASDQDITAHYLRRYPQVYQVGGTEHRLYSRTRYWLYFADAIWQSLVIFYAYYLVYENDPNAGGHPDSMLQFSSAVALVAIMVANLMPGFNTYYWTWFQFFFVSLELVIAFLWVLIYGMYRDADLYGMGQMLYGGWSFWLTLLVSVIVSFLPRYVITFVWQWWYADVMATVRHIEKYDKRQKRKKRRKERSEQEPFYRRLCCM